MAMPGDDTRSGTDESEGYQLEPYDFGHEKAVADNAGFTMASNQPGGNKLFLWFFLGLFFYSLYLLYEIMQPFLHSVILACTFAALLYPFYKKCLSVTGNRRYLAGTIVLVLLIFLVVIPLCLFIAGLIPQAKMSISMVSSWLTDSSLDAVISKQLAPVVELIQVHIPDFNIASLDINKRIIAATSDAGKLILDTSTFLLSNTVLFIVHFMLILLIIFFLLMEGPMLISRFEYYCPLKPEQTTSIIDNMRRIARSVLVGGFAVAALQGFVGGIGLAIVGIPAFFWGTVMVFAALVPVVGTGLVWVPAVLVLLLNGNTGQAIFLGLWCVIIVTSIDSFLRPFLLRDGARVPVLFIFLSILGGVNVFGMLGLLYGPMILGFVAVMLEIYGEEYRGILDGRKRKEVVCDEAQVKDAEAAPVPEQTI